ncbi:hypothetical protein [Streptomyces sp. NPDC017448]|uniref:hypothetical protein n=1 Tax=Streptomyces sp. NPDC017448 TaxID=3364996 RepID=UPI0037B0E1F5
MADDGKHQAPRRYEPGEGALTTLIRFPVRIVVLVLVLPVRMVGDALTALRHGADRVLPRPLGRVLLWLGETLVLTRAPARRAAVEAGRAARAALASARETVRQARRDAWRALAGSPAAAPSGEPRGIAARTLGSTPTVPSAAQATETPPGGEKLVGRG